MFRLSQPSWGRQYRARSVGGPTPWGGTWSQALQPVLMSPPPLVMRKRRLVGVPPADITWLPLSRWVFVRRHSPASKIPMENYVCKFNLRASCSALALASFSSHSCVHILNSITFPICEPWRGFRGYLVINAGLICNCNAGLAWCYPVWTGLGWWKGEWTLLLDLLNSFLSGYYCVCHRKTIIPIALNTG